MRLLKWVRFGNRFFSESLNSVLGISTSINPEIPSSSDLLHDERGDCITSCKQLIPERAAESS